jgi:hypothetical protein
MQSSHPVCRLRRSPSSFEDVPADRLTSLTKASIGDTLPKDHRTTVGQRKLRDSLLAPSNPSSLKGRDTFALISWGRDYASPFPDGSTYSHCPTTLQAILRFAFHRKKQCYDSIPGRLSMDGFTSICTFNNTLLNARVSLHLCSAHKMYNIIDDALQCCVGDRGG